MTVFLAALAGGAIGVLLTWLARLTTVGREIRAHDRAIRRLEDHLERWVCDETPRLRRELSKLRNNLSKDNIFYSGEYGDRLALAKEAALQAYRDQENVARAQAEEIIALEGPPHELLRRWKYPKLRAEIELPETIAAILAYWAKSPAKHLSEHDQPSSIDDPRQRTAERTHREIDPSEWE